MKNWRSSRLTPREVEDFLADGKEAEARKLVKHHCHLPGQKGEDYWHWGEICRDLAMAKDALKCYDLALAQEPNNPQVMYSKAQLLYEIGLVPRAKRLAFKLLSLHPHHQEGRKLLEAIYQETGEKGALDLFKGPPKEEETPIRYFPPSLGPREIELFLKLFSGRDYKVQLYLEPPLGRLKTRFLKGAITPEEARTHLLGESYWGFFPLREDIRVSQGVFKIAPLKKEIETHLRDRVWLSEKAQTAQHLSLEAYKTALNQGLACALERLNKLEYRLWFFFHAPVHLLWSKRFLEAFIQKLPYPQMGIAYHLLLPTSEEGLGWRERWLELPLGVHPATRERSLFIDTQGQPYPQQLQFLKTLGAISTEAMKSLCTKMEVGILSKETQKEELPIARLRAKCPLLDHLVKKAQAGRILSKREKQALLLTLGKIGDGKLVHKVLLPCPDYSRSRVDNLLKSMPPYPISCYKLREWFPEILPDHLCNCRFTQKEHYPTPILHVLPHLTTHTYLYTSLKEASPKRLLEEYVALLQEEKRLQERKELMEDELMERLEKQRTIETKGLKACLKEGKLEIKGLP